MTVVAVVIAAVIGGAVGALLVALNRKPEPVAASTGQVRATPQGPVVDESVVRLLGMLPQASIVVSSSGAVLHASVEARSWGIVDGDRIANPSVSAMVGEVVREGVVIEREMQVARPVGGRVPFDARVRATALSPSLILVLITDLSESRRIEEVRRDFVANVSHELKTPVGALGLLAEAVEAASDDPEQVRYFAGRMRAESARLSSLVADIIDLSRLQGDHPLDHACAVSVDRVMADAIDSTQLLAGSRAIEIVRGGTTGLTVLGDEAVLATAVRNLLSNAVTYSPNETRVAVATRLSGDTVEISVTDQGIGIPVDEQDRIFERFYRVDPGRSRGTGGTGLGLSIVKHVCLTHGGDVSVWSRPGEGSTFTMRIPAYEGSQADSLEAPESQAPVSTGAMRP